MPMTTIISGRLFASVCAAVIGAWGAAACGQNDWQFPDPYFGAFQHRQAGTPQAERKYREEIAPQQPQRLHEHRHQPPPPSAWRPRAYRQRMRAANGR